LAKQQLPVQMVVLSDSSVNTYTRRRKTSSREQQICYECNLPGSCTAAIHWLSVRQRVLFKIAVLSWSTRRSTSCHRVICQTIVSS